MEALRASLVGGLKWRHKEHLQSEARNRGTKLQFWGGPKIFGAEFATPSLVGLQFAARKKCGASC
jgi:hypothetical protein